MQNQFTIPLPAISGRYTSISLSEIIDSRVFSLFTKISQEEASSLASLKERMVTVAFANDASGTKGSLYSEGNIQIHKGKIQVEFSSSNGTTVNFHQNGGTLSGIADGSDYYVARVLYNTTYTAEEIDALASTPSRAGYQFAGWRMKDPGRYEYSILMEDVTEVQEGCYKVSSYQFTMVPAVLDLYAFWTKEQQTYTVTFHANGHGTAPKAQTVAEGEKASRPATPTASGYVFDGWYREAACKNAYDFDTIVTSDIDLYAKWTQITAPTPTPTPEVGDPIIIEQGPKILTAVAKKNKVTVTWKAIKNNTAGKKLLKKIKSIQIQSATNKKFTKNVQSKSISVKKTKATLKLSRKTTYYIRMRYVGKVGGFSLWGNVKKVKTQ